MAYSKVHHSRYVDGMKTVTSILALSSSVTYQFETFRKCPEQQSYTTNTKKLYTKVHKVVTGSRQNLRYSSYVNQHYFCVVW